MTEHIQALSSFTWPLAIMLAWLFGEMLYRWATIPRITSYGLVGFAFAHNQTGLLTLTDRSTVTLLATYAFALILFELGYRVNLKWLKLNRWVGVTAIAESALTFIAVYTVASLFGIDTVSSLLLASICISTSPAAVLRVANDLNSRGVVTERILHLTAINCMIALIIFKIIVGYWILASDGNLYKAAWHSLISVAASSCLGFVFGIVVTALLNIFKSNVRNTTIAFATTLFALISITDAISISPLFSALAFGLTARHRRIFLTQAQRNFGALGDLLTIFLFTYVAASLDGAQIAAGLVVALAIIAARLIAKCFAITALARVSGTTFRKGLLTGVAMMPLSVFAILLLEQTRHLELSQLNHVATISAIVLLLEIIAPLATQMALKKSGESNQEGRQ